jgi:hypothetical protein
MPTRRARRPDGQYYRSARRQRLSRGDGVRGGLVSPIIWADALGLSAILLVGLLLLRWLGPAGWMTVITPLLYLTLIAAIVSAVILWRTIRG